jgi:hypothetical protein
MVSAGSPDAMIVIEVFARGARGPDNAFRYFRDLWPNRPDPTRAMLPFIFAASAVQSGDQATYSLTRC